MKSIPYYLLQLLSLLTIYSIINAILQHGKEEKMNHIRLSVEGLEYMETQDKVRNQLEGIIGVQSIALHDGQDYVDISFDDQTTASEINSHLQNNGYKVTDSL